MKGFWTTGEVRLLTEWWAAGHSVQWIAVRLGRSEAAVTRKRQFLNLPPRPNGRAAAQFHDQIQVMVPMGTKVLLKTRAKALGLSYPRLLRAIIKKGLSDA